MQTQEAPYTDYDDGTDTSDEQSFVKIIKEKSA